MPSSRDGDVHAVADDRVAHALLRADIADQDGIRMDADPDPHLGLAGFPPLPVQLGERLLDPQRRDAVHAKHGRRAARAHPRTP